jgi:hypothetical protein
MCLILKKLCGRRRRYLPQWTWCRPQEGCSKNTRPEYRSLNIINLITIMIYLNTRSVVKVPRHWIKSGEESERKCSWVTLRYYHVICLTGLRETTTNKGQSVTKLRCYPDTCRNVTPQANTFWKSWFEWGMLRRVSCSWLYRFFSV